jgi:Glycosyl transferase family 2
MAKATVYIPTFNRAAWVGGAIESVLAQTWRDFRLVVSDNASRDGTPEAVAGFLDPRLEYVRRERNLGLNEHFNACIAEADTEYLFLLPDDDRLAPDALERLVAALDRHPGAGLAHGQADIVDEGGRAIAPGHHMTGLDGDAVESGAEFIRRSMAAGYRVHASTALLRTEALAGLRLDERDFPLTDLGLWMRLALRWDVAFVARPLASYRIHDGSYSAGAADVTSGGYRQGVERILKAREVKLRLVREHGLPRALERPARRALRRELIEHAGTSTLPERRLGATARALAGCLRLDAAVALEPAAWKLLLGSILGRRMVAVLKGATA